jgi:hypothetical protein
LPVVASHKLLEFGWDVLGAEFVRDKIRTMEQQPFNGVVMTIKDVVNDSIGRPSQFNVLWAFDTIAWSEADMKLPVLSAIKWQIAQVTSYLFGPRITAKFCNEFYV